MMDGRRSKEKGNEWERDVAKALSYGVWGMHEPAVWRSKGSGAFEFPGDLQPVSEVAYSFFKVYFIECKVRKEWRLYHVLLGLDKVYNTLFTTERKYSRCFLFCTRVNTQVVVTSSVPFWVASPWFPRGYFGPTGTVDRVIHGVGEVTLYWGVWGSFSEHLLQYVADSKKGVKQR